MVPLEETNNEKEYSTGFIGEEIGSTEYFYDDFIAASEKDASSQIDDKVADRFESVPIRIKLSKGMNVVRLMNHRRQENTLTSYAKIQEELTKIVPDHDIIFSLCVC